LSEGGTCALELASVHPEQFATFGDFSGDSTPLLRDPANTVTKLFGGSEQAWLAHEPERWFGRDASDGVEGVITVGSKDKGHIPEEEAVESAAVRDHMDVRLDIIPGGGHDFRTWAKSLRMTFPWIVSRLVQSRLAPTDVRSARTGRWWRLTRGCVASISGIEVGEASRRCRIVAKEPVQPIHANDNNMAMAA
jgi:hypothetical protein